jgi:hypothetical protein
MRIAACCVLIGLATLSVFSQKRAPAEAAPKVGEPAFEYSILSDETKADPDSKGKILNRIVEVLMNRNDFDQENLTTLFRYLSERYPKPIILDIVVHTDLKTFDTPNGISSASGRRYADLYWTAWYSRFLNGTGGFSYRTGDARKLKTIHVKIPG